MGWGKAPSFCLSNSHVLNAFLADDSSTKVDVKESYETEASTL